MHYYFINCVVELQLVISQFNDFRSIVLQDFPIIWKNSPEHLKLQYEISKYDVKRLNIKYIHVRNGMYIKVFKSTVAHRRFECCASVESTIV